MLPFVKMSGTGNDFILIDNRARLVAPERMAETARLACRRRSSVGADGMILIEDSYQADFRWRFFNGDGSEAEMCGNGARCAARFAYMQGIAPARMRFETMAGIIEAQVAGIEVSVRMTAPEHFVLDRRIEVKGSLHTVHSVNTGVPHAVLLVDDAVAAPVRELGARIRHHQAFMPAGTNVNFVELTGPDRIKVRTYERGVEDETLACGTGAVAGALIGAVKGMLRSPVAVTTSGGEVLTILFNLKEGPGADNVFLKGPARIIYLGELNDEALFEG
jgi:diaminopimelate epimerase